MPIAAEWLVRDRFPEFQEKAAIQQPRLTRAPSVVFGRGATQDSLNANAGATQVGRPTGGFMREFFEKIGEVQTSIKMGNENVRQMNVVLEEALLATTKEREKAASDRLCTLVEETNGHIGSVKRSLELLRERSAEEEKKKPGGAEARIRANMERAMAKKHQQLLYDFQKAQGEFKQALERRQTREMAILMPDATAEDRAEMIERGETASMIVTKRMAGTHALLLDEVQRIQEKHHDIQRLEASIADLAQMFQEMAVLVDAQGEMLDAIEVHVHKSKGYTAKAIDELITTRKKQHQNRKWMCCITIFMLILLLAILGPVIIAEA
jgi:t-SNARE complex subunit (syntaxin)